MTRYGIHLGVINTSPHRALAAVKAAGFSSVLLHLDGKYPNTQLAADIAAAGLEIENVHAPWDGINEMWLPGDAGDARCAAYLAHMERCAEIGVHRIVYHVSHSVNYPPITEVGVGRFSRLTEAAERLGIDLCLENQRYFHFIDYLFYAIDSDRLRFCFDSGHEACFSQTKVALAKYRPRLYALHLHDNDGAYQHDEHLLPGQSHGVDWDHVRHYLADYDGTISLETKYIQGMPPEEYYALAIKAAHFVKE